MYSLPDGDPCSGHSTMLGALVANDGSLMSHEDPDDVLKPMILTHIDDDVVFGDALCYRLDFSCGCLD